MHEWQVGKDARRFDECPEISEYGVECVREVRRIDPSQMCLVVAPVPETPCCGDCLRVGEKRSQFVQRLGVGYVRQARLLRTSSSTAIQSPNPSPRWHCQLGRAVWWLG